MFSSIIEHSLKKLCCSSMSLESDSKIVETISLSFLFFSFLNLFLFFWKMLEKKKDFLHSKYIFFIRGKRFYQINQKEIVGVNSMFWLHHLMILRFIATDLFGWAALPCHLAATLSWPQPSLFLWAISLVWMLFFSRKYNPKISSSYLRIESITDVMIFT